jgi:putative ABC transport system permease protein
MAGRAKGPPKVSEQGMRWYQRLFRRSRTEKRLDAELRFHLEQQVIDYVASGMTLEDARRRARLEFGGLDQVKEECRDVGAARFVETLIQDVRYGLRQLRRNPGFTAVAVITLALGIGANTVVFSVVNAVLLKPLAYHNPDRIVTLSSTWENSKDYSPVSAPDFRDWHEQSTSFSAMAYYKFFDTAILTGRKAEYRRVAMVTPQFFRAFDVRPAAGREFTPDEERPGSAGAAIVSFSFARSHFDSISAAVNQVVHIYDKPLTIVGVLPPAFHFPDETEIWFPVHTIFPVVDSRGGHNYWAIGRLKPGIRLDQAQAEMSTIAQRLAKQYPSTDGNMGVTVTRMRDEMVGNVRLTLYLLLAAVGLLLLIACANVATLLLARASARAREIVIRAALGASRKRTLRQLVTESVLLALLGGGAGLVVAIIGSKALILLAPGNVPRLSETGIDARVLAFTLAASLLASILFGLVPAFYASRTDLNEGLKQGTSRMVGSGALRIRGVLAVAEIAFTVVLLVGAGLLVRSFLALDNVPLGFHPDDVLVMDASVPAGPGLTGRLRAARFYGGLLDDLSHLPGVLAAGATMSLPGHACCSGSYWVDHLPKQLKADAPDAVFSVVTPGTFAALGVPLKAGRDFNARDAYNAPLTAIINETLGRRSFPGQDPIGRTIFCGLDTDKPMRIVGIVGDVRQYGPAQRPEPEIYVPYGQHTQSAGTSLSVVVRTTIAPGALAETLRRAVYNRSPDVPVRFSTLDDHVAQNVATPRFRTLLLGIFAAIAVCLAMAGVYGVLAYRVSQRTNEIGLRMALGATPGGILRLVLRQGLVFVGLGVTLGLAGALAATRVLTSMLFEVKPTDPIAYAGAAVLIGAVALAASYTPARRAARIDPTVALRHE